MQVRCPTILDILQVILRILLSHCFSVVADCGQLVEDALSLGTFNLNFFAIEAWQARDFCVLGNSTDGKHLHI